MIFEEILLQTEKAKKDKVDADNAWRREFTARALQTGCGAYSAVQIACNALRLLKEIEAEEADCASTVQEDDENG